MADPDDPEEDEIIPCTLPTGKKGSCQPFGVCAGFELDQSARSVHDQGGEAIEDECYQGEG